MHGTICKWATQTINKISITIVQVYTLTITPMSTTMFLRIAVRTNWGKSKVLKRADKIIDSS
jgi:hypothetical protein